MLLVNTVFCDENFVQTGVRNNTIQNKTNNYMNFCAQNSLEERLQTSKYFNF